LNNQLFYLDSLGFVSQIHVSTGKLIRRWPAHHDFNYKHSCIAVNSRVLMTSNGWDDCKLWDINTGKFIRTVTVDEREDRAGSTAWRLFSHHLASFTGKFVRLYDSDGNAYSELAVPDVAAKAGLRHTQPRLKEL